MRNYVSSLCGKLTQHKTQILFCFVVLLCFLALKGYALASGGKDILEGTEGNIIATLNGSGKKYIYITEGILSLAVYIKTKNLLALFGIVVVAVFLEIILKVAGAS
jgi:hypothetical protein